MLRRRPPSTPDQLKRIERLSRAIPDPSSYMQGRIACNPSLPTNILCFVRRDADVLAMRRLRPRDQHRRFVFLIAVRGTGRVCIDTESFSLREGQTQLVFPFQFHSYLSVQPARVCWVFITFEMENETEVEPLRSSPSREMGPGELALLTEIIRSWTAGDPPRLLQLQLAQLLTRLATRKVASGPRRRLRQESPDSGILSLVNRHVMGRLDRPIVLKTMAAALGQSESHLRRRFRLATGLSLGRHLRELRLQRACSLLHDTSLTVSEVACKCGFDSIYSFSRAFKNGQNLSPRAYRRSLK